jgi:hypothetical protein
MRWNRSKTLTRVRWQRSPRPRAVLSSQGPGAPDFEARVPVGPEVVDAGSHVTPHSPEPLQRGHLRELGVLPLLVTQWPPQASHYPAPTAHLDVLMVKGVLEAGRRREKLRIPGL